MVPGPLWLNATETGMVTEQKGTRLERPKAAYSVDRRLRIGFGSRTGVRQWEPHALPVSPKQPLEGRCWTVGIELQRPGSGTVLIGPVWSHDHPTAGPTERPLMRGSESPHGCGVQ